ncbi:hypothetical protein D0Y65_030832 [Glycine soja]|uniref:Uncharacterized protein n=1 Tax=Glycine soja TaxID=3848 RepID=A0A445I5I8_GLYSO|nr:hypothetical protein D0Y65_030832 [Glycine soja]
MDGSRSNGGIGDNVEGFVIRFAFRDRPLSGKGDFGFLQIKVTKTKEQLSSHSNNKSSSFQYLLSQSFSLEQKNAFDTLSSSAAINQTNVIAMSSQSSTGSSVVLSPTALPYLDASTQNMTILFNGS